MHTAVMALAVLSAPAHAAQLRLVVPTQELSVGQTVFAELQLINGNSNDTPEIETPVGLRAQYTGTSQSMSSVNFQTTRIMTYNLGITALQEGVWTLGPARVTVKGEVLTAPAVTFTVRPRSDEEAQRASVSAELSDSAPYVGEVEVYHFTYRRAFSAYSEELSPWSFDGFVQVSDAEEGRSNYSVMEGGQRVSVSEVFVPLEALHPGDHTIAPAMLTARVAAEGPPDRRGGLFGRSRPTKLETFTTSAVGARIRPLPQEGRPDNFSGLVGRFGLRAKPSARELALGDSLTLEVRLVGDGRINGVSLPPLESDDFQVYDDSPEYSAAVIDGRYQAGAVFRRAVVPTREGELTVPPIELSVFDPDEGRYVSLRTDPVSISVLPGEEGAGEVTSYAGGDRRRDVESLGDDILPAPGDATIRDRRLGAVLPWLVAAPMVPALALVGLAAVGRRPQADARDRLRALLASLPDDPAARLAALEEVFREAAGLRLGVAGRGVTREQVATLGEEAAAIDEALSRARYGGAEAMADLAARIRAFLEATP